MSFVFDLWSRPWFRGEHFLSFLQRVPVPDCTMLSVQGMVEEASLPASLTSAAVPHIQSAAEVGAHFHVAAAMRASYMHQPRLALRHHLAVVWSSAADVSLKAKCLKVAQEVISRLLFAAQFGPRDDYVDLMASAQTIVGTGNNRRIGQATTRKQTLSAQHETACHGFLLSASANCVALHRSHNSACASD